MKKYKLLEIAKKVNGNLIGEDLEIEGFNAIPLANERELIFVDSLKWVPQAQKSKAKSILCPEGFAKHFSDKSIIEVKDVRVAVAKISELFKKEIEPKWEISTEVFIEEDVKIEEPCAIYPRVYIQKGARIGKRVVIYPGVFIGAYAEIGENTVIYPNAVIYPYTKIGKNCIIHAGVIVGADGFGFAQEMTEGGYRNLKIYHFGNVRIEDNVEVGANTTIDKAVFGETIIGEGTKIDNLVQIGHNAKIGKQNILVSHVAIGGSAVLEDYVMLGGQVGVAQSAYIGKRARIAAKSAVRGRVPPGEEFAGIPAIKADIFKKAIVIFNRLPEIYKLYKEIKKIIKK